MIALLVMTDGRDHLPLTVPSFDAFVAGPISERWIFDDSGDPANLTKLRRLFPGFEILQHPDGRQGFAGAIRYAWEVLAGVSDAEFVFHLEDDFTFRRLVDLVAIAGVLEPRPWLAQMALRRQPWNLEEQAAGGIVEQHPDDYVEHTDGRNSWLEHRRGFTTNPSLYRTELMARGWPDGQDSEGRFSIDLFADDPITRCAYWGSRVSGEWVHHDGNVRHGTGY